MDGSIETLDILIRNIHDVARNSVITTVKNFTVDISDTELQRENLRMELKTLTLKYNEQNMLYEEVQCIKDDICMRYTLLEHQFKLYRETEDIQHQEKLRVLKTEKEHIEDKLIKKYEEIQCMKDDICTRYTLLEQQFTLYRENIQHHNEIGAKLHVLKTEKEHTEDNSIKKYEELYRQTHSVGNEDDIQREKTGPQAES
jgi:hypothetical protein